MERIDRPRSKSWSAMAVVAISVFANTANASDLLIRQEDGDLEKRIAMKDLEAFGVETFETTTPWTDGMQVFEGVSGKVFAEKFFGDAELVRAIALDNYIIEIPAEVFETEPVMIATRLNGESMEPSKKGPFWIMFDFDASPTSRHSEYRNYAVWQLVEIEIE